MQLLPNLPNPVVQKVYNTPVPKVIPSKTAKCQRESLSGHPKIPPKGIRKTESESDLLPRLSCRVHSIKELEEDVRGHRTAVNSLVDTTDVVLRVLDEPATIEEVPKAVDSALGECGPIIKSVHEAFLSLGVSLIACPDHDSISIQRFFSFLISSHCSVVIA